MKVILFGATGMVGQGVLRECLLDPEVETVLAIGRSALGGKHDKLSEIILTNFLDFSPLEARLSGFDACFFCLGISSIGMSEGDYRRVTYDYTLAAAQVLSKLNPRMTFVYVSGMGTDSSGRSRTMWARVKGETENALLRLPFRAVYLFRPGIIVPLHGIKSKTWAYRVPYLLLGPLLPLLQRAFPSQVTTTERIGQAMIKLAKHGDGRPVLETAGINEV